MKGGAARGCRIQAVQYELHVLEQILPQKGEVLCAPEMSTNRSRIKAETEVKQRIKRHRQYIQAGPQADFDALQPDQRDILTSLMDFIVMVRK